MSQPRPVKRRATPARGGTKSRRQSKSAGNIFTMRFDKTQDLKCPICLGLFRDGRVICMRGHMACLECLIDLLMSENTKCPECRSCLRITMPPPYLQDIVTALHTMIDDRIRRKRLAAAKRSSRRSAGHGKENLSPNCASLYDDIDVIAHDAAKKIRSDREFALSYKQGLAKFSRKEQLDEYVRMLKATEHEDVGAIADAMYDTPEGYKRVLLLFIKTLKQYGEHNVLEFLYYEKLQRSLIMPTEMFKHSCLDIVKLDIPVDGDGQTPLGRSSIAHRVPTAPRAARATGGVVRAGRRRQPQRLDFPGNGETLSDDTSTDEDTVRADREDPDYVPTGEQGQPAPVVPPSSPAAPAPAPVVPPSSSPAAPAPVVPPSSSSLAVPAPVVPPSSSPAAPAPVVPPSSSPAAPAPVVPPSSPSPTAAAPAPVVPPSVVVPPSSPAYSPSSPAYTPGVAFEEARRVIERNAELDAGIEAEDRAQGGTVLPPASVPLPSSSSEFFGTLFSVPVGSGIDGPGSFPFGQFPRL